MNEVLLEHSHIHSVTHCLWLLCAIMAELNSYDGDHMAYKA